MAFFLFGFVFWQVKSHSLTNNGNWNASQEIFASLKINDIANLATFDISNFVGKTALEATESKANVITNGTGVNAFVTSIDGRIADAKKREFWEFLVNGSQAQVGAGSYIIQNHDEIQWKITNY